MADSDFRPNDDALSKRIDAIAERERAGGNARVASPVTTRFDPSIVRQPESGDTPTEEPATCTYPDCSKQARDGREWCRNHANGMTRSERIERAKAIKAERPEATLEEIADELGVNPATASSYLWAQPPQIEDDKPQRAAPGAVEEAVLKVLEEGNKLLRSEIAERTAANPDSLTDVLARLTATGRIVRDPHPLAPTYSLKPDEPEAPERPAPGDATYIPAKDAYVDSEDDYGSYSDGVGLIRDAFAHGLDRYLTILLNLLENAGYDQAVATRVEHQLNRMEKWYD